MKFSLQYVGFISSIELNWKYGWFAIKQALSDCNMNLWLEQIYNTVLLYW